MIKNPNAVKKLSKSAKASLLKKNKSVSSTSASTTIKKVKKVSEVHKFLEPRRLSPIKKSRKDKKALENKKVTEPVKLVPKNKDVVKQIPATPTVEDKPQRIGRRKRISGSKKLNLKKRLALAKQKQAFSTRGAKKVLKASLQRTLQFLRTQGKIHRKLESTTPLAKSKQLQDTTALKKEVVEVTTVQKPIVTTFDILEDRRLKQGLKDSAALNKRKLMAERNKVTIQASYRPDDLTAYTARYHRILAYDIKKFTIKLQPLIDPQIFIDKKFLKLTRYDTVTLKYPTKEKFKSYLFLLRKKNIKRSQTRLLLRSDTQQLVTSFVSNGFKERILNLMIRLCDYITTQCVSNNFIFEDFYENFFNYEPARRVPLFSGFNTFELFPRRDRFFSIHRRFEAKTFFFSYFDEKFVCIPSIQKAMHECSSYCNVITRVGKLEYKHSRRKSGRYKST